MRAPRTARTPLLLAVIVATATSCVIYGSGSESESESGSADDDRFHSPDQFPLPDRHALDLPSSVALPAASLDDPHCEPECAGCHVPQATLTLVESSHFADPTPPTEALKGWIKSFGVKTPIPCMADQTKVLWVETDGHKPELAECHWPCDEDPAKPGKCKQPINKGAFGEWCFDNLAEPLTKANTGKYLVESGPGKDDAGPPQAGHKHAGGEGHPHIYDCDKYCKDEKGKASGSCKKAAMQVACGNAEMVDSAFCECKD